MDLGIAYKEARERIASLVSEDIAELRVPATPDWSVHDLLAHLAGVTEDAAAGNMDGATTDPWTAAQVERGRHKSMTELIGMWERYSPSVEAFLSSPQGHVSRLAVVDIATHEADLRNALGLGLSIPSDVLSWAADLMREGFNESVVSTGLPPVEVGAADVEWFRGRLGRRTVEEVSAYDWSRDPGPYLDKWFIFGRAEQSLNEVAVS